MMVLVVNIFISFKSIFFYFGVAMSDLVKMWRVCISYSPYGT